MKKILQDIKVVGKGGNGKSGIFIENIKNAGTLSKDEKGEIIVGNGSASSASFSELLSSQKKITTLYSGTKVAVPNGAIVTLNKDPASYNEVILNHGTTANNMTQFYKVYSGATGEHDFGVTFFVPPGFIQLEKNTRWGDDIHSYVQVL